MSAKLRPALFLDRDGVINIDYGYVSDWDRFDYVTGAVRLISAANRIGWSVVIVTNQSGIARGYFTEAEMAALHRKLIASLTCQGGRIDVIYHCPHHPEGQLAAYRRDCEDRKPRPGMLLRAARDLSLDLSRSHLIGDKETDIDAARAAGVKGHLFGGGDVWSFAAARIPKLSRAYAPAFACSQAT